MSDEPVCVSGELAARDLELVFALAGPVGADLEAVSNSLATALRNYEYDDVHEVRVSQLIAEIAKNRPLVDAENRPIALLDSPEEKRLETYMDGGNSIRRMCSDPAALGSAAIANIVAHRNSKGGNPGRRAYIIRSLKRQDEVNLLRRVYGPGFFLIAVHVSRPQRVESLATSIARSHRETPQSEHYDRHMKEADRLARRDESEEFDEFGQRLRNVFQLADFFLHGTVDDSSMFRSIDRFIRLILGDLSETPLADEQFIFHAHGASLASGALGRQVGAVIVSPTRELLGIGWNDVPKGGGGLYRADDHYDKRDIHMLADSTNIHADRILSEIADAAVEAGTFTREDKPSLDTMRKALKGSTVMSLLEFGRTTHAEMEAILAAARIGISAMGATLYTTTFPCHECARSIITAGIRRVVYIEPYPKSRALELHADAIVTPDHSPETGCLESCGDLHTVAFEPFVGVAPHRFSDLFSVTTGSGIQLARKRATGEREVWDSKTAQPKVEMIPNSYLELEQKALERLLLTLKG